jgi:3D (Asp-Asp-Asp) domain-containing protein
MTFRFLSAAAALGAMFLASCAPDSDLQVVSKSRSQSIAMYGGSAARTQGFFQTAQVYSTAAPSAAVVQQAAAMPKDKHGMPFYKASDRTRLVRTTAYTHTEDDHLQYGAMNAAGTPLRYTDRVRSAAADWAVYPVGTVFRIKGMPQLFVVDDYGSALTGTGTIDIFTPTKDYMGLWGRRNVEISIVQWGSYSRSAELLAQRQSFPHCRQMYAAIQQMSSGTATAYTASR